MPHEFLLERRTLLGSIAALLGVVAVPVDALAGKVLIANVVCENASAPLPIVKEFAAIVNAANAVNVASIG